MVEKLEKSKLTYAKQSVLIKSALCHRSIEEIGNQHEIRQEDIQERDRLPQMG